MRSFDVVEQRAAVWLDGADPVERAGLEGFDRLRRVAHVTDLDILEADAGLLQVVVWHDFERIELEGAERLALELLRRIEAGLRNDDATFDTAAGDDLDRRAGVEQRHEAGVGHEADINLPHAEERHLFGEGRRVDELQVQSIVFRGLKRVRQEDIEIAETGAVRGLDRAGRVGRPHQTATDRHRQRGRGRRFQEVAAAEVHRFEVRQVHAANSVAHGQSPCRVGG